MAFLIIITNQKFLNSHLERKVFHTMVYRKCDYRELNPRCVHYHFVDFDMLEMLRFENTPSIIRYARNRLVGKCSYVLFSSHNIYSALLQRIEHCSTRKSTCRLPIYIYIYIYIHTIYHKELKRTHRFSVTEFCAISSAGTLFNEKHTSLYTN